MKSTYHDYLNSLTKEQLVELIHKPYERRGEYPAISKRKIALRISYDGESYKGVQYHKHLKSIHDYLQNALTIAELGDNLVFCGRTDAGVSAISMVVSIEVNSRLDNPNRTYEATSEDKREYPYDVILNMFLPEDIRVTGWAPVPDNFNARYDCIQRHYRYFFVLNGMDLNKMNEAVEQIGKMDDFYFLSTHSNPKAVYKRKLDYIAISRVEQSKLTSNEGLYYLDIKAGGFLHNMVRKIYWVIQRCGKGGGFTLNNVEIADPGPLVFVEGIYKNKLNFIGNRYNEMQFKKEADKARIKAEIAELRLRKCTIDKNRIEE